MELNPDNIQKLFGALGINEATLHLDDGDFYFLANPAENTYRFHQEGKFHPSDYRAIYPVSPAREFAPKELHIALRAEDIREATVYLEAGEAYYQAYNYNEFAYGLEVQVPQEFDISGEEGAAPLMAVEMANQRDILGGE